MEATAGLVAGSGWASGLSLYLVVALLGAAERLGLAPLPEILGDWRVLTAAVVLYAVELVVDKVPYLDSAWDAVHTLVRPAGATALGALLAEGSPGAAASAGVLALLSHLGKAALRAVANASPEPLSNAALSLGEDGLAAGTVALAVLAPLLALLAVAAMLVAAAGAAWWALLRRRRRRSV